MNVLQVINGLIMSGKIMAILLWPRSVVALNSSRRGATGNSLVAPVGALIVRDCCVLAWAPLYLSAPVLSITSV